MSLFRRWRLRAEVRALRAEINRLTQRLDRTEQQIDQMTTELVDLNQLIDHPNEKRSH